MSQSRREVELPDGSMFEFWMTPLTLAERAKAQKNAKTDDATDFALQLLINVARGQIVDEGALIEALRAGEIRGAGLDVYRDEPLPAASPLWQMENVCLTPHVAGVSARFWERETELIIENVRRYLTGEPMLNVVDKKAGY